jgi:hypothetical protein
MIEFAALKDSTLFAQKCFSDRRSVASHMVEDADTKLFAISAPEYVWRQGQSAPTAVGGKGKSKALTKIDEECIHAFWLLSCHVYASAFKIFARGMCTPCLT